MRESTCSSDGGAGLNPISLSVRSRGSETPPAGCFRSHTLTPNQDYVEPEGHEHPVGSVTSDPHHTGTERTFIDQVSLRRAEGQSDPQKLQRSFMSHRLKLLKPCRLSSPLSHTANETAAADQTANQDAPETTTPPGFTGDEHETTDTRGTLHLNVPANHKIHQSEAAEVRLRTRRLITRSISRSASESTRASFKPDHLSVNNTDVFSNCDV